MRLQLELIAAAVQAEEAELPLEAGLRLLLSKGGIGRDGPLGDVSIAMEVEIAHPKAKMNFPQLLKRFEKQIVEK
jgi:hypothetical protein